MNALSYRELEGEELSLISEMAGRIWPEVYAGMISPAQIEFMLAELNSTEALQSLCEHNEERFWLIERGGEGIGYFAIAPQQPSVYFLDKLYLLPEYLGKGLGTLALREVFTRITALGGGEVRLRVNRHNSRALRCYERNGFELLEELCSDIGGGFFMDDFVLRKLLISE